MNRAGLTAAFVLFLLMVEEGSAQNEAADLSILQRERLVILMRHADTPDQTSASVDFRMDDCTTQPGLTQTGTDDARRLGEVLEAAKAAIGAVESSAWCRTLETARLVVPGYEPRVMHDLGTLEYVKPEAAAMFTRSVRARIADWQGPGTLLMVTHRRNLEALIGEPLKKGGFAVLRPDGEDFEVVLTVTPLDY